jgi:hypothetical protein
MGKYIYFYIFVFCFLVPGLQAQRSVNQDDYRVQIKRAKTEISVDGDLAEEAWLHSEVADNFWMSFPVDDKRVDAELQTEVRMVYDDDYIYFGVVCYGDDNYVIQTLKRDTDFWSGDAFALVIDPVNQQTNGFVFGVNPAGVQMESLIQGEIGRRGNGGSGMNTAWDNKWFSQVKSFEDRWTIEIAIPFKTLRFKSKSRVWGINFVRGDAKTNSFHTWAPVPVQFRGLDLGYAGAMIWDNPPKRVRNNISIIPYTLGSYSQDFDENEPRNFNGNAGFDAKVAITSSLNLDVTFNPDFSQVEVDRQVTNLTRFNIRFPERRLFFLENSDLFQNFGIPPMRPFFSRRLGLDENANPIPILYGLRLSGNLNDDLRIGVMNLQTRTTDEFLGQNYTSFAFHQRVLKRSTIKGFVHNRQAMDNSELQRTDYNRNVGLEFNYLSADGKWRAFTGVGGTFSHGLKGDNHFYQVGFGHDSRNLSFYTNLAGVGNNYVADMGFIPLLNHYDAEQDTTFRVGFHHNFTRLSYTYFTEKNPKIISHQLSARNILDITTNGDLISNDIIVNYQLRFTNTSNIEAEYTSTNEVLLYPFAFTDGSPLPAGRYDFQFAQLNFESDQRKLFIVNGGVQVGQFFNGTRNQYRLGFRYRAQPWGNFGIDFEQNDLRFPEPYGQTSLFLISPRFEINFSRDVFWTTFLQYNTQADNFNINSRLQWRFQPMSDLFIVYTDNYAVEFWGPKNRALVVKLNYWFNI